MKNKKKIVLFLALIALFIFIGGATYSFAKYFTKSDNSLGTSIKRWDILVNDETIRNKTTLTNKITAEFPNTNGHTAKDNIAPGVEGKLNIKIDYTNVDVSFKYDLSISKNETIPDISLADVEVEGGNAEDIEINTDDDGITHVTATIHYNPDATSTVQTITAIVKWDDNSATASMNNKDDTKVGVDEESVDFDVKMSFIQIEE